MKVLLVDDNRLMLEGLQNLLEAYNIEVAGMAKDGWEAVAQARELKPDVILMDIRMPGCDGLTATRLIKAEMAEARIVILTTSTEDQDLFEAVKSGACGYLVKSMDANELVEALDQVIQGFFLQPVALGIGQLFAQVGKTLLGHILFVADVDNRVLPLVVHQCLLRFLHFGLQFIELLFHPT